ncbi:UNVERIFIED_ORG: O-antigen/teichoic acid export membrane protein [Pseudomonas psychrophila]
MNIRKSLKALSSLWIGSIAAAFLAFLTQVILARTLGPGEYGVLSSALSAATLIAPLAGFGIPQLWLKIFGVEGFNGKRWVPVSFKFIKISSTFTIALLIGWAQIAPHNTATQIILYILAFHIIHQLFIEITSSKLQLEERYQLLSLLQILPHALRLAAILTISLIAPTVLSALTVAMIYATVSIPVVIFGILEMSKLKRGKFSLKGHKQFISDEEVKSQQPTLSNIFFDAMPFGMAATFHLIMFQVNIILINYLAGPKEAGIYNVAFAIMTAVYLTPSVIYQKFLLPKIHRWAAHDREKFIAVYKKGNIAMLLLGVTAMICVAVLAPWGVPLLFGEKYSDAVPVLQILSICAPLRFLASSVGVTLVTQEHMKLKVYLMGIAAAFNTISSIILIQKMSLTGAAVSTVVSDLLLLSLYYYYAQKKVFSNTKSNLADNPT